MPRNGSNIYSPPAGTTATPNTPIESAKYNAFVADLTNDLNLARPIVAGGTGATTKSGAQQALDLEPGVDIQAYNAKLAALAALTLAADKLIYATGTDTLATSDLTAFARTLLAANDLSAIWALLYLGSLAGKSKISVPGDIDAGGSAGSWSVLYGDGNWGPSPVAIANADPGVARILDAALSTTVTSAGQDWVAARMIARGHGGIGTLSFAERYGATGMVTAFGENVAGSDLRTTNVSVGGSFTTLSGTWRCLGSTASRSSASGREAVGATLWQRIA